MKIKFNWGTGIFIFLALFLLASAGFIIYAFHQKVNLVHRDYYEKGNDYTGEMDIKARSACFNALISISEISDSVKISFPAELDGKIDSGNVLFYRPSDMNLDVSHKFSAIGNHLALSGKGLVAGRYIIRIKWFTNAKAYEVDKEYIIGNK